MPPVPIIPRPSSPTVVLCCAAEDQPRLGPVLERLGRRGLRAEVVSGVDLDASGLRDAIRRNGVHALYALCRSEELDFFQCAHLGEVLEESDVQRSHVVDVTLSQARLDEVVRSIVDMARRIERDPTVRKSPDVPAILPAQWPEPAATLEPVVTPAPSSPSLPIVVSRATSASSVAGGGGAGSSPAATLPLILPSGPGAPAVGSLRPPAVGPATTAPPGGRANSRRRARAARRRRRRLGVSMAGVATLALVIVGLTCSGGDDNPIESPANAAVVDEDEPAIAQEPEGVVVGESDPVEMVVDEEAPGAVAELLPDTLSEPESESESVPEPEPEPVEDERSVDPLDEVAAITAAIRRQKIRALDLLLVIPRPSRRGPYAKAVAHCDQRQIDGVGGWRLPTVGEVRVLAVNRIISKDHYWTVTKGDPFGAQQLVWNGHRQRIQVGRPRSKRPRAVCVRDRVAEG